MEESKHSVLIETRVLLWHKRHRAKCSLCSYRGDWRKFRESAMADGWYHDDVSLFKLLTTREE